MKNIKLFLDMEEKLINKLINKSKKNFLSFVLFIFLIFGCNTKYYSYKNFESLKGLYLYKNGFLKEYIVYMNLKDTFKGNWTLKNDTVFLKIENPKVFYLDSTKSIVREYPCMSKDSLYFNIKIIPYNCQQNYKTAFFSIYFNDNFKNGIFAKDSLIIKKFKLNSFYITTFQCVASCQYNLRNKNNNCFDIKIFCQDSIYPNILRINPTNKYLKVGFKLIPIMNDTPRKEFALKRKFFIRKR